MTAVAHGPGRQARAGAAGGWLDRPLTSYYVVVGSSMLLLALGLVMVLSASSVQAYQVSGSSFSIAAKQAIWVAIGLPVMVVASRTPAKVFRRLAYPLLLVSIVLLLAVLVPHVGVMVNGARRWIALPGGMNLQPSEPAKLSLVLWGADLFARKERLLADWKHLLVPLVPVSALLGLLVMAEPDMGTTIVLMSVMLALLFVVGAPMRLFGGVLGVFGVAGGALAVLEPYRLARLTSFTHPFADPLGSGYQAVQGLYALASGGWWGLGLGASREKWAYLPNQYTDFIFAIIGEELGLIGAFVLLALFGLLGYGGLRIARRSGDRFTQLAAAGITAWLLSQAVVNIGYVCGVLPVTGIPLPLVSFGGSSLVPTLFALGMLASFARAEPEAERVLAARRRTRRPAKRPAR